MNAGDAATFLRSVAASSRLAEPAPPDADLGDMRQRVLSGAHDCHRCGAHASWASVIGLRDGSARWVDLCWMCARWVTEGLTDDLHAEADQLITSWKESPCPRDESH